ncbi:MAG: ATP-binding protein [Cycloclasticus sp.]|jgi:ATPases of the AAA+ class
MQQLTCNNQNSDYLDRQFTLTDSLFKLGVALQKNEDGEDVLQCFKELQMALASYISNDRIQLLKSWFMLDDLELKLLSLTYINLIEPESISPFLQLSWYEQGPSLSLERLLLLCQQGGVQKNHNIKQLLVQSRVFSWNMLQSDDRRHALIQPLYLAEDVYLYLLDGHTGHDLKGSQLLSMASSSNPVVAHCYSSLVNQTPARVNILSGLNTDERASVVAELAVKALDTWHRVISSDEELIMVNQLIMTFRSMLIQAQGRPCYLYWPDLLKYCLHDHSYTTVIRQLLAHENLTLFIDDMRQESSSAYRLEHISENCLPPKNQWRVYQLSEVRSADIAAAWLVLSRVFQEKHGDAVLPLVQQEANTLANLYPLSPATMTNIASQIEKTITEKTQTNLFEKFQKECLKTNSQSMGQLAQLFEPRYVLKDMVLMGKTLDKINELVDRVRYGSQLSKVLPNFLPGIQALFWGKPGTGKSMAAEAIAGQLKLPLYKVNLANIASKWIGETEKHLSKLFDDAQKQNAVLLFDEADAVFAKRSEVASSHDKNANMGVSFLLQRMESYTGLLLLSSNFKGNLDDAFMRRFHSMIEFPMPDTSARITLWNQAWPENISLERNLNVSELADLFEFSPSQIKNIAERSVLFSLTEQKNEISRSILSKSIRRELEKQNSNYLAEQKLANWLGN